MTVMFDSAITELKHRQFISSYNNFVNLAKNEVKALLALISKPYRMGTEP